MVTGFVVWWYKIRMDTGWFRVEWGGWGVDAHAFAARPKLRFTDLFLDKEKCTRIPRADPLKSLHNFQKRTFVSRSAGLGPFEIDAYASQLEPVSSETQDTNGHFQNQQKWSRFNGNLPKQKDLCVLIYGSFNQNRHSLRSNVLGGFGDKWRRHLMTQWRWWVSNTE